MNIEFVDFDSVFLDLSYIWLTDQQIKSLTNTPELTKSGQKSWFEKLSTKKDYMIWGVQCDSNKIGACGLKDINNIDGEYWGYIGNKDYWGKGIGRIIMVEMEQKAKIFKLKSIWLKVLKSNERAINLYKKMDYLVEKNEGELIFMRKLL